MTLKEWKARMQVGVTIRCIWRNYWETRPQEKPASGYQDMTVVETQTNGLWLSRPDDTRRSWMTMPKASEIIHTHVGFELFHNSLHVATYVYLHSEIAA
jgi:hypothetical protein